MPNNNTFNKGSRVARDILGSHIQNRAYFNKSNALRWISIIAISLDTMQKLGGKKNKTLLSVYKIKALFSTSLVRPLQFGVSIKFHFRQSYAQKKGGKSCSVHIEDAKGLGASQDGKSQRDFRF